MPKKDALRALVALFDHQISSGGGTVVPDERLHSVFNDLPWWKVQEA